MASEISERALGSNVILQGFADADLVGNVDSSKSTSGYIYTIGGTAVSWMFRL